MIRVVAVIGDPRVAVGWLATGLAVGAGLLLAWLPLPLAAGLLIGTAVLFLLLRQPLLAVALMLFAGPWGALENVVLGNTFLDSGQLLFLLLVALWLAWSVIRRRRGGAGIVLPITPLNIPLALFIAVALFSLVGAPSPDAGARELLKWFEIALVMWIVIELAGGTKRVHPAACRVVLAILLVPGLSQALIGIWQFVLRGHGPEHFIIPNLLSVGTFYRAYGTFEQPNPFGGFMGLSAALGLGAGLGLVMAWWQQPEKRRDWGWWLWTAFVVVSGGASLLALLMSWSRGAWLGFAAALGMLLLFWPRRWQSGLALVLLAGGVLALAWQSNLLPAPLVARFTSFTTDLTLGDVRGLDINDTNYAVLERLAHWQSALEMARANLWAGVGFGNYEAAYSDYALLNWPAPLGHAHNYYLNLLAEVGVLGTGAYLLLWAVVFWQTGHSLTRLAWPERGMALGLLAAWAALTVHHALDKLYVNNLYLHLGVMFGLLQLLFRASHGQDKLPVNAGTVAKV